MITTFIECHPSGLCDEIQRAGHKHAGGNDSHRNWPAHRSDRIVRILPYSFTYIFILFLSATAGTHVVSLASQNVDDEVIMSDTFIRLPVHAQHKNRKRAAFEGGIFVKQQKLVPQVALWVC